MSSTMEIDNAAAGAQGASPDIAQGYMLSDFSSGDEVEVMKQIVPGISFRVTKGASPMESDEDAIVSAMMEQLLGGQLAKSAVVSIFPKALSMKFEAESSWPVTVLQCELPEVYQKMMAGFRGGPLDGRNEVYQGCRLLELCGVTFPSSQAKKNVTIAYVREGFEQHLPEAPELGAFEGVGLSMTVLISNTMGLSLQTSQYNRLAGQLVMKGNSAALSKGGKGGGEPWAREAKGVEAQLARYHIQGKVVKAHDPTSGQHKCGVQGWRATGSKLRGLQRGARMVVRCTHLQGGSERVDPKEDLPPFLLRSEVAWAFEPAVVADSHGRRFTSRLCTVPIKLQVPSGSGYEATALEDEAGLKWWLVGAADSCKVPEGYKEAGREERAAKREVPVWVVHTVSQALRSVGTRLAEEKLLGAVCGSFLDRANKLVLKQTRGDSEWRANLTQLCEAAYEPAGSLAARAVCPEDACCRRGKFPCVLISAAQKSATAKAVREVCEGRGPISRRRRVREVGWPAAQCDPCPYLQVGGDAVTVEAVSISLGGGGGGTLGKETGGNRAGGGGGGGRPAGGKQKTRAAPAVEPVTRKPARGMGMAPARGRGRKVSEVSASEAPGSGGGEEAEGPDAKKQRSEAESEAEEGDSWWLPPPSRVTESALLEGMSAEVLENRLVQLNKSPDCVVNATALPGFDPSEVGAVNGVLRELQYGKEFTHNKRVGWSVADFDRAAQV